MESLGTVEDEHLNTHASYDQVPYRGGLATATHPQVAAAIGSLFGLSPRPPERARVLEIGCGTGANLTTMAYTMPASTFIGIDLSAGHVQEARDTAEKLGLANTSFHQADVIGFLPDGLFDYVICHGVFSWVPAEARAAILEICRRSLAPAGIAHISYNAYPGWHFRGAMREMMRFHARYFPGLDERVGQARAFAGFLADASQHFVAGGPTMRGYASTMQSEFELVARSPDHYVMHEHLADVNQPFYFQEFIDLLEEHDLQYLGDANFSSMLTNNLPPDLRTELEEVSPNLIVLEQYRDFVVNRLFRQSLIVRADARINRQIDPAVVNGFSIRGTIRPSGNGEWAIPQAGGLQRVVHDPLVLGILASIDDAAPQSLSFQELLDSLPLTVWDRDSSPLDRESRLAPLVFSLFASEALELRLWDPDFCPVVSERPCVFAPARLADNRIGTPSPYHITIGFNSLIQWMIPLLDGTRSAAEVSEMLALAIHDGSVTVPEPEDSDALTSGSSDELVADGLEKLRRWALLESWRQPSG